jgi:two-component system nitrogen regulation response regulator GlnG
LKKKAEENLNMPKSSILVVDDDESIRKVVSEILTDEGYNVKSAATGKEATEKAEAKLFNIALIDIILPDTTGVDLLTKIKETKPKMRKIIITGYPSLQNAVEALNKGADAYIMKPLNMDKMLATIKEQLQKQIEEQEMTEKQLIQYIETRAKQIERKS